MSSNSGDKTTTVKTVFQVGTKPPENEPLPCPRCQSTSTKFCYYNNYNLAQPRYFCKSCRRYWTRGGTLRNVPVGGGTRKSAAVKRSRAAPSTIPSSNPVEVGHEVNVLNLNQTVCEGVTTLVDTEAQAPEPEPIMGLTGDFGSVLDSGSGHGLGFELSTWDWSLGEVGGENDVSGCSTATGGGRVVVSGGGCNTWQVDNVLGDGEYYNWSDLAISTPANGVK